MLKIKTKYDYAEKAKRPHGVNFTVKDKSLTNQSDLPNTDINNIMARFEKTGLVPGTDRPPMYGDFTEVKDFHTQLSAIRRVEEAFLLLPAKVRNRFQNNPQDLINFLEDSKNDKEAVALGLKEAPPPPPPNPADKVILPPGTPGEPPVAPAQPATPPA
ncbi:MAG: internal scaffolding protein [Arizlama microvirus]|nr:MAG: internal scaffolding protein [Arizlama microvirus]